MRSIRGPAKRGKPERALTAGTPPVSDASLTTTEPTKRQVGRREASTPFKVTGRLKRALMLMVWENRTDNEAAVETGMTLTNIRLAFQRPHVRAYLREQREVLRARECGRNLHTLLEVRDQKANAMARVKAVQEIERPGDNASAIKQFVPGFCVQIVNVQQAASMPHTPIVEAKPLKSHDDV